MGKKKMVLYGAAALFAVSGVVALPSGNITGGIGCIVIGCRMFSAGTQTSKRGSRAAGSAEDSGNACRWQQDCGNHTHKSSGRDFPERRRRKQAGYIKPYDGRRGNRDRENHI